MKVLNYGSLNVDYVYSVDHIIVGGPVALGVTRLAEHGVPLTEAFYPLTGKETYIRAECIDEHGHTAWTNPIWLSEFAKRKK